MSHLAPHLGPHLPRGSRVNERGHLEVGGCDVIELAREYGTPAYVYAEDDIRSRAQEYLDAFAARTDDFEIVYASKAAPIGAVFSLVTEMGLSVDVASAGELHAALRAGAAPARIYLHGNNKTHADLRLATEANVGHIVCDSFDEVERLDAMLDRPQHVMIRVTPGIKANTHSFIQTGQLDSKFGFGLEDGLAARGIEAIRGSSNLHLAGLHAHIGSQIFELEPYVKTIEALARLADDAGLSEDELKLLNVGGGLGIAYEPGDDPPSIEEYVDLKVKGVERVFGAAPRILVEPGRSLVGNAGITIYEIGTVKEIPGVRTYVAVDGGMSDNLRPMLYEARYDALVASRASDAPDTRVTVAGMHCESSDIIVRDVEMAAPAVGDILATPATGAYGHAMANNYNGMPRPPVIFTKDGQARVVVRRETLDDLVARDVL
jgi:diaminopimelate decarboxylase